MPPPGSGTKKWQRTFVRDCTFDDVYASHTVEELKALAFSPRSTGSLTSRAQQRLVVKRREARIVRVPLPLGEDSYCKGKQIRKRPKDEWIPVPVPASGVRLKTLVQVRRLLDGASQVLLRCSDAFLGTLRASCAAQAADEGSSRSPRGRANEEGWDPQEAPSLRVRHSSPER